MKPVHAVGMAARQRMMTIGRRAPYLSHKGPRRNRIKTVPHVLAIDVVQTSDLLNLSESEISGSRGLMENQTKNDTKTLHQAQ
jgi:hypothetical protein